MIAAGIDQTPITSARDVARYFLALATEDGDLITNLKMQKMVYYAYVHTLVGHLRKLFAEPIEAWPNGPVVHELYTELKHYKAVPLDEDFLGYDAFDDDDCPPGPENIVKDIPDDILLTLGEVYEYYIPKSASELVKSSHEELPWIEARHGLGKYEHCNIVLRDEHIMAEFSAKSFTTAASLRKAMQGIHVRVRDFTPLQRERVIRSGISTQAMEGIIVSEEMALAAFEAALSKPLPQLR